MQFYAKSNKMKNQIRQNCINALKNSHTNIHQALQLAEKGNIRESKNQQRLALTAIANSLANIE